MRFADLNERQRRMILEQELTDLVIAQRLGVCPRTIRRFRTRLQTAPSTAVA